MKVSNVWSNRVINRYFPQL